MKHKISIEDLVNKCVEGGTAAVDISEIKPVIQEICDQILEFFSKLAQETSKAIGSEQNK